MNTNEIIKKVNDSCELFSAGKIDDSALRKVLGDIPQEVWQQNCAVDIIKILIDNERLYDLSLEKCINFSKFICEFVPKSFWNNSDNVINLTAEMAEFFWQNFYSISYESITSVLNNSPASHWQDDQFCSLIVQIVAANINIFEDLACISDVFPDSFFDNENNLKSTVYTIFNTSYQNADRFWLFPSAAWSSKELILDILDNFQSALEQDRYHFTMYPTFRGSDKDYLLSFLDFVNEDLKSDKDFVWDLLQRDYFIDEFMVIYNWIDQELWNDKDFVLEILNLDHTCILKIPDSLAEVKEIKDYVLEEVNVDYFKRAYSDQELPQWVKDWEE